MYFWTGFYRSNWGDRLVLGSIGATPIWTGNYYPKSYKCGIAVPGNYSVVEYEGTSNNGYPTFPPTSPPLITTTNEPTSTTEAPGQLLYFLPHIFWSGNHVSFDNTTKRSDVREGRMWSTCKTYAMLFRWLCTFCKYSALVFAIASVWYAIWRVFFLVRFSMQSAALSWLYTSWKTWLDFE
jgi:hypothetical protein